jgi:hypothetical protein
MKTFLIPCLSIGCCLLCLSGPVPGAPDTELTPTPANPGAIRQELEHLRKEFERKRGETLRPLAGQYVAQLEALQKELVERDRAAEGAVAEALAAAKETYARLDQPELRHALTDATWIWRSNEDSIGVVATFRPDGTVEHVGLRGQWRVSGPNEITIATDGDGDYVLRFVPSLRTFEGNRKDISGTAVQSPVDTLCGNVWTLRDDKLEFRRDGQLVQLGRGWEGLDWRLSRDGGEVTVRFKNGNGGTFQFENGGMTHFDGSPFRRSPRE